MAVYARYCLKYSFYALYCLIKAKLDSVYVLNCSTHRQINNGFSLNIYIIDKYICREAYLRKRPDHPLVGDNKLIRMPCLRCLCAGCFLTLSSSFEGSLFADWHEILYVFYFDKFARSIRQFPQFVLDPYVWTIRQSEDRSHNRIKGHVVMIKSE